MAVSTNANLAEVSHSLRKWIDAVEPRSMKQFDIVGGFSEVSTAVNSAMQSPSTSWDDDFGDLPFQAPPGLADDAASLEDTNTRLRRENEQLRLQAQNMRLIHENALLRKQCMDMQSSLGVWQQAHQVQTPREVRSEACVSPKDQEKLGKSKTSMVPDSERTTVMIRNLPNNFTRTKVVDLLNSQGFRGVFDFLYMPIDFQSQASLGYAFVNLKTNADTKTFWEAFDGFSDWGVTSQKVCGVCWSSPHQGLEDHIERFRNSPVMHENVPVEHKPMIFNDDGEEVPFPPPTKKLRVPRVRPGRGQSSHSNSVGA